MPRLRFRYCICIHMRISPVKIEIECTSYFSTVCNDMKVIDRLFTFSMPSRPTLRLPGGHREDKENRSSSAGTITMIHETDDDDDGPILYRDDEDPEMEDEGKFLVNAGENL